jgi:predicted PurR-regulated permease PerM
MLSILAVLISLLLVIGLLLLIVVPSVIGEVESTLELIRAQNHGEGYIPFIPESWQLYIQQNVNMEQITDILSKENLQNAIKEIAPRLWFVLSNTFSVLFSITIVFIILLYFVFILLDYEKISNGWIQLIPDKYRPFIQGLADDVESSMNRYFRGQSLVALCVGILFAIGFRIIGFPLAITLGLFIGVLNLIPYLQTIGLIPILLLSLLKSAGSGENFWFIFGLALLVLLIVQVIQDLFLVPRIMGKAMGLNPAVILLSLSIWGSLLGFIGLIIALPLTTLCLSYYKRFILKETNTTGKENDSP